jgi:hypothetical protein
VIVVIIIMRGSDSCVVVFVMRNVNSVYESHWSPVVVMMIASNCVDDLISGTNFNTNIMVRCRGCSTRYPFPSVSSQPYLLRKEEREEEGARVQVDFFLSSAPCFFQLHFFQLQLSTLLVPAAPIAAAAHSSQVLVVEGASKVAGVVRVAYLATSHSDDKTRVQTRKYNVARKNTARI